MATNDSASHLRISHASTLLMLHALTEVGMNYGKEGGCGWGGGELTLKYPHMHLNEILESRHFITNNSKINVRY